jgi:ribose transport system substrate-binding protein
MEMTLQKFAAVVIAISFAAASAPALAAQPTIPIIVKDTTDYYWRIVLAGARKAGKDLNVNVPELGAQSEADVNAEISTLSDAAFAKPAAIVIAPSQSEAFGKAIEDAAKKTKIVAVDSPSDGKSFVSQLTTDNAAAGRAAADALGDAIKDKYGKAEGEVALIASAPGGAADQRAKGFKDELAAKYPGLKLTVEKVGDGQTATASKTAAEVIGANANLRGLFSSGAVATAGAGQALADAKKSDAIKAIGFDPDPNTIKFLQDGTLAGVVVQDPFRMGYDGIKTALAASKGEQVPATIDTGAELITKANLDAPRSQELLNPKIR